MLKQSSFKRKLVSLLAVSCVTVLSGITLVAQNITLNIKNVTVQKGMEYLQREHGYSFSLKTEDVDISRIVSLKAENASIEDVLKQLFIGQKVQFDVSNSIITVVPVRNVPQSGNTAPKQNSNKRHLAGKILDENSDPLIGAYVMEKGDVKNGTVTDINGSFALDIDKGPVEIVITYIGYEDKTVTVAPGQTNIKISMRPSSIFMEEAVVVGYGSMALKNVTSAIGKFKPDDLDRRPVLGPDQFLQGHVAGVNIVATSGVPDAATRVSIRGIGSLNAGNEPLWVVDGIPITGTSGDAGGGLGSTTSSNGMITINPNDIESIEVLKDAASAAIYGSRATNGVIIVTTKKGKKGMARVGFDASVSCGQAVRIDRLEIANADSFIEMLNEGVDNYNIQNGTQIPRYSNPAPGTTSHNWFDDLLRTAWSYNASLSISGGNDNMLYYVSGGYKHTEGVIKTNEVNQYSFKVNLSGDVKKWLSFGINSQLNFTHNNRVVSGYSGYNVIKMAMEQYPWQTPILPNGEWAEANNILIQNNPLRSLMEQDTWVDTYRAIANAYLDFKIVKGLDFKTSIGTDFKYFEEHNYFTNNSNRAKPNDENPSGGSLIDVRKGRPTVLMENILTYIHDFKRSGFSLNAVLGQSYQYDAVSIAYQQGLSFPSSSLDVNDVAVSFKTVKTTFTQYAMESYFGRAMLNYKDRYILTGTLRTDGSSKFSPKNRYGFFPSTSLGWNVNEESWWPSPATNVKIRASWGRTGNEGDIGPYAWQSTATAGYNYNGNNGFLLAGQGNEDLKWETAEQTDLGIDLSFFKGALTMTADVFKKNTYDLLYSMPTMATTGYTSFLSNIGAMSNKGLELSLGSRLGKGDFRWSGDLNISFVRNKLTKLLDDNEVISTGQVNGLKVGEEVGSFYVVKFLGIYQRDEDVPELLYNKYGVRAGDCIYEDYNNDGDITNDDKQFCGSPNPKFSGGFNTTFSWKGIDLSMMFTYSYGNQLYEYLTGGLRLGNGVWPALKSAVDSRWTGPGTTNKNPRPLYGGTWNNTKYINSRFIHDASYMRCRNISLGYTFPYKITDKMGIQSLKVYAQIDNLFILTAWPYLDPEVSSYSGATNFGTDWMSIGQPRTFTFGVNLKF